MPTPDANAAIAAIVARFRDRELTTADLEAATILGYQAGFAAGRDAPPAIVKIGNAHTPEVQT